ncbi:MAG: cyclopropane fatty acyl phospholipid synthase, partial [Candidatus Marinimicrobia bacterium]|nr:cyclopropane fatty acyl phospholipid synthase [Candidatus Neomarinimicrobiota bacterium]
MKASKSESIVRGLFESADIQINGSRPQDIQVHDNRFYSRLIRDSALGFGESYMDGWWDCESITELVDRIYAADIENQLPGDWRTRLYILRTRLCNLQKVSRAFQVGQRHYDIGNDLYRAMLDKRMVYSCAYWRDTDDLDAAQEAKLDLICRKLELEPGMTLLDIGCGWGALARYAAEKYDAQVVGVTVSRNQVELGQEMCRGLPVEIRLEDYRKVTGEFDRVVSVGFFEHVGYKNYREYMEVVARCLKDDGISLLHTIGHNISVTSTDRWVQKYIFPNSMLPSVA